MSKVDKIEVQRRQQGRGRNMTDKQFRNLVQQMRDRQKEYFRTKDANVLNDCKRLEREVDRALVDIELGETLFAVSSEGDR